MKTYLEYFIEGLIDIKNEYCFDVDDLWDVKKSIKGLLMEDRDLLSEDFLTKEVKFALFPKVKFPKERQGLFLSITLETDDTQKIVISDGRVYFNHRTKSLHHGDSSLKCFESSLDNYKKALSFLREILNERKKEIDGTGNNTLENLSRLIENSKCLELFFHKDRNEYNIKNKNKNKNKKYASLHVSKSAFTLHGNILTFRLFPQDDTTSITDETIFEYTVSNLWDNAVKKYSPTIYSIMLKDINWFIDFLDENIDKSLLLPSYDTFNKLCRNNIIDRNSVFIFGDDIIYPLDKEEEVLIKTIKMMDNVRVV
jgi:hypothetical protein